MKFYLCKQCGNVITYVKDKGIPVMCCGQKMEELQTNCADAAEEKHVPVVTVAGENVTVSVGSAYHPMTEEHSIEWVAVESQEGWQVKRLCADKPPVAKFKLSEGDHMIGAYAYCNLHGLWRS